MAERKRNRNALFSLDHKLYASDYDSDSVASENHSENRPLQAPLSRLSPARQGFRATFLNALSYLAAWNWLKVNCEPARLRSPHKYKPFFSRKPQPILRG